MKNSTLFFLSALLVAGSNFAQSTRITYGGVQQQLFQNSGDVFGTRVFIENKGQFDNRLKDGEKIYYSVDNGNEQIYFTAKGLVYEQIKTHLLTERQKETLEEGKDVKIRESEHYFINMNWVGCNSVATIEADEKQFHYMTYGGAELNSNTFKKITYRNVYNKIDIEYVIPDNFDHGIKYNVIAHPGAKISDLKIVYSGAVGKIRLKNGNVVVNTELWDITEHAPKSFYKSGGDVNSLFSLRNDTISFSFPNNYSQSKTLIIDPFVSSITTLSTNNYAYDVDYDFAGNAFIYGGSGQAKVAMYNSAGTLQWTFAGIVASVSWSSMPQPYIGNFGVEKFLGKTYIGQGFNGGSGGGATVIRIDNSGNFNNFKTTANSTYNEIWELGFHCITGDVFILGGGTTSNIQAATINSAVSTSTITSNAFTLQLSSFTPTLGGAGQDILSHAIDDQGNIFVIYAGNVGVNNKILRVNSTFNGNVWLQATGYTNFQECANKLFPGTSLSSSASNGFNALAVNGNYLYYYNGINLAAYSKATGTLVGTALTITGHTSKNQGGIAVDDCDVVYVGGNNGTVKTFSFNGTSFSTLTPIALSLTTTNQYVTDIKLNRATKLLYVTGSGFVGTYSAVPSATCSAQFGLCVYSQAAVTVSSNITCAALGSATVSSNGGTGPFSYTWIPSYQTGSVATNLAPGNYTILVYDIGANATYTTNSTLTSTVPLTATVVPTPILDCYGAVNGTAAINISNGSGASTYTWYPAVGIPQYNTVATGLTAGTHTVDIQDVLTGCTLTKTFTVVQPTQLYLNMSASSPTACSGTYITLSGMTTGGNPSYTYTWTNGPTTDTFVINTYTPGVHTYTLNSQDAGGCFVASLITITVVPNPAILVPSASICPLAIATLSASGATSYTWNNNPSTTGSTFTVSPLFNQVYSVLGSAQGCTSTANASVFILPTPNAAFASNSPICAGQTLTMTATGGTGYTWTGPSSFTSVTQSNSIPLAQVNNGGPYTAKVTGANGCTTSITGTAVVKPLPLVSIVPNTPSICIGTNNTTLNALGTATLFSWTPSVGLSSTSLPNVSAAPLASTIYTVVGTLNGCTAAAIATVYVVPPPNVAVSLSSPSMCAQGLNGSPNTITLTGLGATSYTLLTPPYIFNPNPAGPSSPVSLLAPYQPTGAVTATLFGSNGICTLSTTTVFYIVPNPTITLNNYTPLICAGKTFTYVGYGASSYNWSALTPGAPVSVAGSLAFANPNLSSVYSVYGSSQGCNSASRTTTLTVQAIPTVAILPTPTFVCLGSSVSLVANSNASSFYWTPAIGLNSNSSQQVIASPTTKQSYTVIVTQNTCTNSAVGIVSVMALPVPVIVASKQTLCVGDEIELKGSGGSIYTWAGPNNIAFVGPDQRFRVISPGYSGNYTLMVTDTNGCRNTKVIPIKVNNLPDGYLSSKKLSGCVPFCSDFKFTPVINTTTVVSQNWSIGTKGFNTGNFSYCFVKPGDYIIRGTFRDTNQCVNNATVMIHAYPLPVADFTFSPETPVETIDVVSLFNTSKGEKLKRFSWYFSNNDQTSSSENTTFTFNEAGAYPVALIVKNEWGCTDSVVKVIKVDEDFAFFVPNAFTPNDDNKNEGFLPVMRGVKFYNMAVFNRWGQLLFETSDVNQSWNGTYNGSQCKDDVYIWKAKVSTISGQVKSFTGHVNLIR